MPGSESSILLTLRERDRWEKRAEAASDPREKEQASRQVAYYRRLVSRMKKRVVPTDLAAIFHAFFR